MLKATLGLALAPLGPGPTRRVPLQVTCTLLAATVTAAAPAAVAIEKLPAHSVVLVVMTIPLVGLTQPVAAPARDSTAGVPSVPTAQALGRTQSAASKVRFNVDMTAPFRSWWGELLSPPWSRDEVRPSPAKVVSSVRSKPGERSPT